MQTQQCLMTLALCLGTSMVCAADVEFEFGPTMFEEPATGNESVPRFESPTVSNQGFGRRFTIEGHPNLDSPLYEGLWPMTLNVFRGNGQRLRMDVKISFPLPVIPHLHPTIEGPQRVPAGTVFASDDDDLRRFRSNNLFSFYDSPLFDGLYPMTIEEFKRADAPRDKEVFTFCIAFNR